MDGYQTGPSTPASPGGLPDIPGIMRRTRPWVLFLGVLSLIGVAFMVCALLALLVLLMVGISAREALPSFIAIPAYALGIIFDLLLGIYLLRYASRIARYVAEPGEALLAEALEVQRVYWKFVGILAIVAISFGIVAGIAVAILGIAAMTG